VVADRRADHGNPIGRTLDPGYRVTVTESLRPQTDSDATAFRLVDAPSERIDLVEVTLRRWQPEWTAELQRAVEESLPELRPFMPWASDNYGIEQSREFIARSVEEWDRHENFNYAILAPDGSIVGSSGLMTRMGEGVLEIGYWIHSAHTGRGHASAVADALAQAALALPGIDRAAIRHDPANPASGRVAEKAGFVQVGEVAHEPTAPAETGVHWIWERRG
jgi:RimJ/RimL family protein N-acetyltransferase